MSAVCQARDILRNSSVQLNLRSQRKKAAKKQDGRLYRRTFSQQLLHKDAQPSSRLLHRAFDYRANHAHGIAHSHRATTRSIARDCYHLVYRAYRGMVNAQYRVDHRASISSRRIRYCLPVTHRHCDINWQRIAATATGNATIAIGKTSPPPLQATPPSLSATRRRHRYRQNHDRHR